MAKPPSSANSFGAFLEGMQRTSPTGGPGTSEPLAILRVLTNKGALKAPELLAESSVDVLTFAESLRVMRDAGLISLAGPAGQETVDLTPAGASVASLALK